MRLKPDIPTIASLLGIIATIVALGWWGVIGWTTPEKHKADIDEVEQHALHVENAIAEFQNRWLCDEDSEELAELLAIRPRTDLQEERVRKLRNRLDDGGCHKYDD